MKKDSGKKIDPVKDSDDDVIEVVKRDLVVISARTAGIYKDTSLTGSPYAYTQGADWNLQHSTALDFVRIIEKKFANNNKFHGYFPKRTMHVAPGLLSDYIQSKKRFFEVVSGFMNNVCDVANEPHRGALSVGHIIFVHYSHGGDDEDIGRLLVVMVGKQSGFDFNAQLEPVSMDTINTSELRQAAMFDLTLFKEIYPENVGDAYLRFILGKSKSSFFKEALGCGDYIPNKDSVDQIGLALVDFLAGTGLNKSKQLSIREKVGDFLNAKAKKHLPVSLVEVQHVIDRELPTGNSAHGKFVNHVNTGGYTVSAQFEPTRSNADSLVTVAVTDPDFNFKLKLGSVGYAGSDKRIIVDDDLNYVTMPLDDIARRQLRAALERDSCDEN